MVNLPLTKAQEILRRIKDKQQAKEIKNGNTKRTTDDLNVSSTNLPDCILQRVEITNTTEIYSYPQQYKLYLNLVVYYILNPTIIPPLHPYQKMLKKLTPLVYAKLYSTGTYYSMIALDKSLLSFVLTNSSSIEEYNKITNTLLASLKEETLKDISSVLNERINYNGHA